MDQRADEPFARRESQNGQISKHIYSPVGCHPKVALLILENGCYGVSGEAVCFSVMVGNAIMDAVEAVRFRSDPQRMITIHVHRVRHNLGAIEPGNHVASPLSSGIVLHSQLWPGSSQSGPNRPRRPRSKTLYSVARWIFRLIFEIETERVCREAAKHFAPKPDISGGVFGQACGILTGISVFFVVTSQVIAFN